MKTSYLSVFFVFFFADLSFAKTAARPEAQPTRNIMAAIYEPLSELIPMSLDAQGFTAGKNREKNLSNLTKLAKNAHVLELHAKSKDPAFEFISRSLARDAKEILHWYKIKRYDEAKFILDNFTENCVACHSQRPGVENMPQVAQFFEKVPVKKLPLLEKAQLQTATRQFDDALISYETLLGSNDMTAVQMSLSEAFADYLKLAIRIKRDLQRPIPVLEAWLKRPGAPEYMLVNIQGWIGALKAIQKLKLAEGGGVASAKRLIAMAQDEPYLTFDRAKFVYYVAASGLLQEAVSAMKAGDREMGEAYYLLGICESVIGRSYWLSQTEFFLEAAIRTAPGSDVARKSYALLEEQMYAEFSGSSGMHLPEDVRVLLAELKGLSKGAKAERL